MKKYTSFESSPVLSFVLVASLLIVIIVAGCDVQTEEEKLPTDATLSELAYAIVDDQIMGEIYSVEVNESVPSVVAVFDWPGTLDLMDWKILEIACHLRETRHFDGYRLLLTGRVGLVNQFGETSQGDGVVARLLPDVIERINCEMTASLEVAPIADYYEVHPALED